MAGYSTYYDEIKKTTFEYQSIHSIETSPKLEDISNQDQLLQKSQQPSMIVPLRLQLNPHRLNFLQV